MRRSPRACALSEVANEPTRALGAEQLDSDGSGGAVRLPTTSAAGSVEAEMGAHRLEVGIGEPRDRLAETPANAAVDSPTSRTSSSTGVGSSGFTPLA